MPSDSELFESSRNTLSEEPVYLIPDQRKLVKEIIHKHCNIRKWKCLAVNCRTNHVHVLVSVPDEVEIKLPRKELKDWATRHLKKEYSGRTNWWNDGGWDEIIEDTPTSLDKVLNYICNQ